MGVYLIYTPLTTREQEIEIANKIATSYTCDIQINESKPYTLYCANDIGKILDVSNIRMCVINFENVQKCKKTNGGTQKVTYITYDTLIKILVKSRKNAAIEFAKRINLDVLTKYCIAIETDIIECILTTFDGNVMETQYNVDNYRIDLYFVEYNLAIECDERHHANNKINDDVRQFYIQTKLGCRFIRFRPHDKDFNLFQLLNDIYIHLSVHPRRICV